MSATGSLFQYSLPSPAIDSVIVSGFSCAVGDCALGKSSLIACVSSGAVMMKMTSSTSITSTSGVVFISAIGAWPVRPSSPPNAMSTPSGQWPTVCVAGGGIATDERNASECPCRIGVPVVSSASRS